MLFRLFEANVKRLKTCSGAPVKCTPGETQAPPTISRPSGRTKAEPDGDEWITGSDGVEQGRSAFVCACESTRESVFVCHVYHDTFQTNLIRHYRTQTTKFSEYQFLGSHELNRVIIVPILSTDKPVLAFSAYVSMAYVKVFWAHKIHA